MKLRSHRTRSEAGVSLIECLVYIGLFTVLLLCGSRFFTVVYQHNKAVAKAAGYTSAALDAARHWRRDIANAKGEPKLIRGERFDVIRIDQANGERVSYRVNGTRLERHNGDEWVPIIRRVASSIMLPDQREHVRAWRWELAMETKSRFLGDPGPVFLHRSAGTSARPAPCQGPTPYPDTGTNPVKIRTNPERGAILTAVLLALAAWALVLLNFNSSNSHGLRHRLKAYEQENRDYLTEKYADQVKEVK